MTGTLRHFLSFTIAALALAFSAEAKTVHYELTATRPAVNLSGKKDVDFAIALNGTIPAPTLEFTEGDDAEIIVRNQVPKEELSIHWHGILLPPEMDGVPYLNTPPIRSGESFTFRFPIRQSGTYWYHSHTGVQEQKGVYGPIVIHPRKRTIPYDRDVVVVLSDWSDENAEAILHNLRKDGDYYLHKKKTVRSWLGAIQAGRLGTLLGNEWDRMGGMDYSDVGYDAFLINGKRDSQLLLAHPGERIRLRIINAAASTYFHVALGQQAMNVISADGVDVTPVAARELLMGMAETYDVLFEVPEHRNYELKITAQDGTGTASGWIGMGEKEAAPTRAVPDLYAPMDHSAHGGAAHAGAHAGHGGHEAHSGHEGHQGHEGHASSHAGHGSQATSPERTVEELTVDELEAKDAMKPAAPGKTHELKLVLGGDMSRYVWHINGKAIHQERTIEIREGDVVRFEFVNETMMHHPMHLHGHFFRVLNRFGAKSPLKHTVDVPPHGSRTIEFVANEPGEWMLHCHNLYHMKTGMGRVVKYLSYTPKPEIAHLQHADPHLHEHIYFQGMLEAATNHGQARLRLSRTWDEIEARIEARRDPRWDGEGDLFYRRWFGNFFSLVAGATSFDGSYRAAAGAAYLLPLLIRTQLLVDHHGELRLDVGKRFQWTSAIFSDADFTFRQKQDSEFEVSLMYGPGWHWSGGLMVTAHSVGAGIQFQF